MPKFLDVTNKAAARAAIEAAGLTAEKNVFTGKAEWGAGFIPPFDSQIWVASLAVDPELMTQGIYIVHRVNGDLHADAPGGVSDTHDAFATEIFATEAVNAKYLNALESSCTVDGPTEILFMCSGLFNGGATGTASGTVDEWQVVRVDTIPPIPEGLTIDKLTSLYVKGQAAGEKNYSLYVEGGNSVIRGPIVPDSPDSAEALGLRINALPDSDGDQTLFLITGPLGNLWWNFLADGTGGQGSAAAGVTWQIDNGNHPDNVALRVKQSGIQTADPFRVTTSSGAVLFGVASTGVAEISQDIKLTKTGQTRIYNSGAGTDSIKIGGGAGVEVETYTSGSFSTKFKITQAGNVSTKGDIELEKSGATRIYNNQNLSDSITLGGANGIDFQTWTSGFTTKVKLTAAGNLGVGTESPSEKLDVNGTVKATSVTVGSAKIFSGTGSPESVIAAGVGSLYMRTDGGAGTSLYVKESGSGTTGWVAK